MKIEQIETARPAIATREQIVDMINLLHSGKASFFIATADTLVVKGIVKDEYDVYRLTHSFKVERESE